MNGSLPQFLPSVRLILAGLFACLTALPASAGTPAEPAAKTAVIGQPHRPAGAAGSRSPSAGPRAMQQIVVTGRYADGTVRDLTAVLRLRQRDRRPRRRRCDRASCTPKKNGAHGLVVKAGGQTACACR